MKKILILLMIPFIFFNLEKESFSISVPYTPVIVITSSNRIKKENEINDKFEELYKNNKDFIELKK